MINLPPSRLLPGMLKQPTLSSALAGSAFLAAMLANKLREAGDLAFGALIRSSVECEESLGHLRSTFAEQDVRAETRALTLEASRHAFTCLIDTMSGFHMTSVLAEQARGVRPDEMTTTPPNEKLVLHVAQGEVALRGPIEMVLLYRRRAIAESQRVSASFSVFADHWRAAGESDSSLEQLDAAMLVSAACVRELAATLAVLSVFLEL